MPILTHLFFLVWINLIFLSFLKIPYFWYFPAPKPEQNSSDPEYFQWKQQQQKIVFKCISKVTHWKSPGKGNLQRLLRDKTSNKVTLKLCQIPQKEGKTTKFWKDIKVIFVFQKSNCNCVTHTALDWQQLQKADFAAVWHQNHVSPILPVLFSNGTWGGKKADSKAEEFCIAIPVKAYDFFKCLCWGKKNHNHILTRSSQF